jgi:two-component system OmpR family response regulator
MSRIEPLLRPLSVLVVDDLADAADTLVMVLALCGFAARAAYTSVAALRMAAADRPDAVVLEVHGPGGLELARRLRAVGGRPLLVACTTCAGDADRQRSADAGVDVHLVKPADPAVLIDVLRRYAGVPP